MEEVWDDCDAVHDAVEIMYWEMGAVFGFPWIRNKVLEMCTGSEP